MLSPSKALLVCLSLCAGVAWGSGYRTVTSKYSDNTIRFKSWPADDTVLCHGGTAHHAGWADIGNRHLFFWFQEARSGKEDAPLMIWHQGGPGGSSLHGMLYENGPCLSDGPNTTRFNAYSWAEHFNIIYLDQPAGVGFSYVDENGAYPSRAEESALDSVAFIRLFYEAFPQLAQTDLHLAGESYAGRYIPAFASAILEYNQFFASVSDSRFAIPLRSLLLGNPWINPHVQLPSMYDVSCNTFRDQFQPHLDPEDCQKILPVVDRCESVLHACVLSRGDPFLCRQPHLLCQDQYMSMFQNVTRSMYDRRLRHCQGPGNCYPDVTDPEAYLNSERIFHGELEVSAQTNGHKKAWDMMSGSIFELYNDSGDMYTPATPDIQKVLQYSSRAQERGGRPVDVLVYVGVADIICNADGVLDALRTMHWTGRTPFRGAPWQELPWNASSGGRAGWVKAVPNLWLVEVEEAGHMVPYDQPASSLKLVEFWLDHLQKAGGSMQGDYTDFPPPSGRNSEQELTSLGGGEL